MTWLSSWVTHRRHLTTSRATRPNITLTLRARLCLKLQPNMNRTAEVAPRPCWECSGWGCSREFLSNGGQCE